MGQYLWYTLLLIPAPSKCGEYTFNWLGYAANVLTMMNVVVFNTDDKEDIESILAGYLAELSDEENAAEEDASVTEFVSTTLGMLSGSSYEREATPLETAIASHMLGFDVSEDDVICLSWRDDAFVN